MEIRIVQGMVVTSTNIPCTDTNSPGPSSGVPMNAGPIPVAHMDYYYGITIGDPGGTCVILRQDEWNRILTLMAGS